MRGDIMSLVQLVPWIPWVSFARAPSLPQMIRRSRFLHLLIRFHFELLCVLPWLRAELLVVGQIGASA
jgi:hypothetical protein